MEGRAFDESCSCLRMLPLLLLLLCSAREEHLPPKSSKTDVPQQRLIIDLLNACLFFLYFSINPDQAWLGFESISRFFFLLVETTLSFWVSHLGFGCLRCMTVEFSISVSGCQSVSQGCICVCVCLCVCGGELHIWGMSLSDSLQTSPKQPKTSNWHSPESTLLKPLRLNQEENL